MWQTVDYKGNTVRWYEAELIDFLVLECNKLKNTFDYDKDAVYVAQRVLDIIEDFS